MKYTVIGPSFCLISKEITKNKDVSEGNCPFSPQVFRGSLNYRLFPNLDIYVLSLWKRTGVPLRDHLQA